MSLIQVDAVADIVKVSGHCVIVASGPLTVWGRRKAGHYR
jgi:hypothetical protein